MYNIHAYVLLCNERNIPVCCKFTQLHSHQISLKSVDIWLNYCEKQKGELIWNTVSAGSSPESCVTAARCFCARVVNWKIKVDSNLQQLLQSGSNCLSSKTDITVIWVIWTIHLHHWLHENHTSAPAPGDTDWNRHTGTWLSETMTSMSWSMQHRWSATNRATDKWWAGADQGSTGGTAPKTPSIFYKHNTTSSCTILQVYGHYGSVLYKRLALLGPADIVDHFAGSGARRLRFVF